MAQSEFEANICNRPKRGKKRASEARLVLVFGLSLVVKLARILITKTKGNAKLLSTLN